MSIFLYNFYNTNYIINQNFQNVNCNLTCVLYNVHFKSNFDIINL